MALAEGGAPELPGRRKSGSGSNIFANKELLAKYEQAASPEKPPAGEPPRRKSWTPPANTDNIDPWTGRSSGTDRRPPGEPASPKSPPKVDVRADEGSKEDASLVSP